MQNFNIIRPLVITNLISKIKYSVVKNRAVQIIVLSVSMMSVNTLAVSREQHDAHTHGVASLTLASENGALEVQFESPAMSLLGFEHEPKTQNQFEVIEKTQALLNSPTKILSLEGADCAAESVNVDIVGPAGQMQKNNHEHENVHSHNDSDEKHTNHDQAIDSHSEVSAVYVFKCTDGEELRSVTVSLFEHFSDLEKIMVNWVTETQQGDVILRPESSVIELR